jgi:hypothetical protein
LSEKSASSRDASFTDAKIPQTLVANTMHRPQLNLREKRKVPKQKVVCGNFTDSMQELVDSGELCACCLEEWDDDSEGEDDDEQEEKEQDDDEDGEDEDD